MPHRVCPYSPLTTPPEELRCFILNGIAYAKGKYGTHGDVVL
jgi:hypothetical protein